MYYKQAKIETRWELLTSIKNEIYTSKKLVCEAIDEMAIIYQALKKIVDNSTNELVVDSRMLQKLINKLTESKNSIYMYQLLYEQTLSKHKFKEKWFYPGNKRYKTNREFTNFLKTVWYIIDEDINRLQEIENSINQQMSLCGSNPSQNIQISQNIIQIINEVRASEYKTYQIDEIALYQFMSPTFKQII